jgi:ketosteroid isomerase-like protein
LTAVSERQEAIRHAYAAYGAGDLEPLRALFDPEARWVGVHTGREESDTAFCVNRHTIIERLAQHRDHGRRFALGDMIERGDRIAVELTIVNPEWAGPVTVFKVFTFRPEETIVVRLNDCIDESYALQVLAA